jgi:hypothetical protein
MRSWHVAGDASPLGQKPSLTLQGIFEGCLKRTSYWLSQSSNSGRQVYGEMLPQEHLSLIFCQIGKQYAGYDLLRLR